MQTWRRFQLDDSHHQSVSSRARVLLRVLKHTCQKMDGVDEHLWTSSLGQNISHVNGPIAVLLRLGVLKNVRKSVLKSKQVVKSNCFLKLGASKSKQLRRLCEGLAENAQALAKLRRYVRFADDAHIGQAPKTCADWVRVFGSLDAKCEEHKIFAPRSYMRHWLIRGVLLAALARDGVEQLASPQEVTLSEFMKCNPDSSSWMRKLRVKGQCGSAKAFFQSIGYNGAPELCSMHLCLLLAKSMRKSPQWFETHCRTLQARMLGELKFGLMKLPALCVKEELAEIGK